MKCEAHITRDTERTRFMLAARCGAPGAARAACCSATSASSAVCGRGCDSACRIYSYTRNQHRRL